MERGKVASRIAVGLRWFAGLFYAFTAVNGLLHITPMPEGVTPASAAFFAALHASGFMLPLLAFCFFVDGLLLLLDRTAPLGLIFLAPPIVVIPLYNALLERQPFTSGPFVVAIELFLAWYYWKRFTPLWSGNPA
jgi:hypothetical protein